jgi:hypothetical protein
LVDLVDLLETAKKARGATIARHVYTFFSRYNMHSAAYMNSYQVYKLALISPVTKVFCERTFSKLKLLKMRLRSTLSADDQGRRKQCEAAGAAIQKGTSFFWAAIFVTRLSVAIIISLHRAK